MQSIQEIFSSSKEFIDYLLSDSGDEIDIYHESLSSGAIGELVSNKSVYDNPNHIEMIKNMPYNNFLESDYWRRIRNFKLYHADYTCSICGIDSTVLDVHHTTYKIRGLEHRKTYELIVCCRECHAKIHNGEIRELDDIMEKMHYRVMD